MIDRIKKEIKQYKKLDYSGIFFHALYLIKRNITILFFNRFINYSCSIKGIKLGKNIVFNGNPLIRRYPNSTISFGDNCRFNSSKNSLTIGLHQPCSFVTVGENAEILFGNNSGASGLKIHARSKIIIGNNVLIGSNCTILDNDAHHADPTKREMGIIPSRPIIIEDNVFIGLQCVILKGVTIGKNSVIGANSVVFNNIPENSIAVGNPCKVIMRRNPANYQ
jgi:acetyltransferase-like isoleucine patch superfamily enzyme